MVKIAVISDVHSNVTALKAVIADARGSGCTDFWYLGDLWMPGPGAHDLLTLLDQLPVSHYVRGNWEDILLATFDGHIDPQDPTDIYATILGDYFYHRLSGADIARIQQLPLQETVTVAGWNFQLTHNQPQKNFGHALVPAGDQTAFDTLTGPTVDVALYGHVHHQLVRQSRAGQLVINPGTVGEPFAYWRRFQGDRRAQYAILDVERGVVPLVNFRRVAYDVQAELTLAKQRNLPFLDFYAQQLTSGVVYTHDRAALTKEIKRLGYQDRFVAIMARIRATQV